MNRHYQVITVGESTIDAFMTIHDVRRACRIDEEKKDLCFKFGEKIDVDRYDFAIGGNATNVAVGLSRLGIKTTLCTEIGDDEFSLKIRNVLANEHIERLLIRQISGPSNFSVVINFKGDRTLFVEDVTREHDFHFDDVSADLVYITSLGNDWQKPYHTALEFVNQQKARLAFNPGSRQLREGKEIVHKVLERSEMLFLNKEEAELLLFGKETEQYDKSYIKELLPKLMEYGPKTVVLTDGKRGSYVLNDKTGFLQLGIQEGEVVERTGAGDAYTTGFLAATLHGLPLQKAMKWGTWNAASVVSKIGAQAGLLTKEALEKKPE